MMFAVACADAAVVCADDRVFPSPPHPAARRVRTVITTAVAIKGLPQVFFLSSLRLAIAGRP
jgi:hypothetical protein